MNDDELTSVLEDAGLSPYQSAAYVALLELGTAAATDVAEACEVPDPRIYDVLRDLEESGYIETYQQDSLTARAHDPETVLGDLRDRSSQYLTAAEEIETRWNEPAAVDHEISIVKRFETVRNRARELIANATDEVVLGTPVDQYRELRSALTDAHSRDVHVKLCLYTKGDAETLPTADELAGSCREARHRDLPAPFLLVADRQWTCFAPDHRSVNQYGVLVNDRTHTTVFHWYFRSILWETWDPIYAEPNDSVPITYVDLVHCLRRIVPVLTAGGEVQATVEGNDTETRERVTVSGRVVDTCYSGTTLAEDDGVIPLSPLAGRNGITLRSRDGNAVAVGGWGARLEDVEARRITITEIDED